MLFFKIITSQIYESNWFSWSFLGPSIFPNDPQMIKISILIMLLKKIKLSKWMTESYPRCLRQRTPVVLRSVFKKKKTLSKWTSGTCSLSTATYSIGASHAPQYLKIIVIWVKTNKFRWNRVHKTRYKNKPNWLETKNCNTIEDKLNKQNPVEIGPIKPKSECVSWRLKVELKTER